MALGIAVMLLLPEAASAHGGATIYLAILMVTLPFSLCAALGAAIIKVKLIPVMGLAYLVPTRAANSLVAVCETTLMLFSVFVATQITEQSFFLLGVCLYLPLAVILQALLIRRGRWPVMKKVVLALTYPALFLALAYIVLPFFPSAYNLLLS